MNTPDPHLQPDAQLLAAYFDGELEGRDELADMRARIEAWLDTHPEAAADWAKHRELQKLWLDTTPAEPSEAVWQETLARIRAGRKTPREAPSHRRPWFVAGAIAASVLILVGVGFGVARFLTPPAPEGLAVVPIIPLKDSPAPKAPMTPEEVFEVAMPSEIVILRVEGADTGALVVGDPPVIGPLELAAPGEVHVRHVHPDARDNMVPNWRHGPMERPMVWARAE